MREVSVLIKTFRIASTAITVLFSSFFMYNALVLFVGYGSLIQGLLMLIAGILVGQLFFLNCYNLFGYERPTSSNLSAESVWRHIYRSNYLVAFSYGLACTGGVIYLYRYFPAIFMFGILAPFILYLFLIIYAYWKRNRLKKFDPFGRVFETLEVEELKPNKIKSHEILNQFIKKRFQNQLILFVNVNLIIFVGYFSIYFNKYSSLLMYLLLIWEVTAIISYLVLNIRETIRVRQHIYDGEYAEIILFLKNIYSIPKDKAVRSKAFEQYLIYALYLDNQYKQCLRVLEGAVFQSAIAIWVEPYKVFCLLELGRFDEAKDASEKVKMGNSMIKSKRAKNVVIKYEQYFTELFKGNNAAAIEVAESLKNKEQSQKEIIDHLKRLAKKYE
ncbi:hypothetical protein FD00_GL001855 [Liquorilactobacillus mali KCTC 3596 = DSM 20444]|uniref:Uncharacterized protein n=2 Tax=Liquorilactobacillus mali TaxID=1618 RepID=A0A0R2EAF9_9LACO|nr:hypothetical protein FD00_GL001855 [Liquorilactobacillus mali KCTC 3596 = DSM 20444]